MIETEAFESFLRDLTLSRDMQVVIAASELLEALKDERKVDTKVRKDMVDISWDLPK